MPLFVLPHTSVRAYEDTVDTYKTPQPNFWGQLLIDSRYKVGHAGYGSDQLHRHQVAGGVDTCICACGAAEVDLYIGRQERSQLLWKDI